MFLSKYSASGNDFIITHAFKKSDYSDVAIALCDRHEGIGADGLVVLIPHENLDFEWLFYNSDGSHADMCGNASRAVGHYACTQNLSDSSMRFLSGAGEIGVSVEGDIVETQLTPPKILQKNISEYDQEWWLIDTGVPHLVAFFKESAELDMKMCADLRQRYNANVNLAWMEKDHIGIRTFERGVEGETLACGTGMAAAFLRALEEGRCPFQMSMVPKSGETLSLRKENQTLFFKGRVQKIFDTSYFFKPLS